MIKIGDIVTSVASGYWKVTNIEEREPYDFHGKIMTPNPLITGEQVLTEKGVKVKRKVVSSWDSSYSTKITNQRIEEIFDEEVTTASIKKFNLYDALSGNNYNK